MLTMNYRVDIPDESYYNKLVGTGMAYEFYPDLPQSWLDAQKEILAYQAKVEYIEKTREDNYEASSRLDS